MGDGAYQTKIPRDWVQRILRSQKQGEKSAGDAPKPSAPPHEPQVLTLGETADFEDDFLALVLEEQKTAGNDGAHEDAPVPEPSAPPLPNDARRGQTATLMQLNELLNQARQKGQDDAVTYFQAQIEAGQREEEESAAGWLSSVRNFFKKIFRN